MAKGINAFLGLHGDVLETKPPPFGSSHHAMKVRYKKDEKTQLSLIFYFTQALDLPPDGDDQDDSEDGISAVHFP